jgi:sugar phosphate isomerase/epimerase
MASTIRDRLGVDINQKLNLEPAVAWACANKVGYIDLCLDQDKEILTGNATRTNAARTRLEREGVRLGLHTLSAVNIAESSPFVRKAVDDYLEAYIDAAHRLGAGWIVVHGGYHFTADKQARMEAAVARLARASEVAEKKKVKLLLENLNPEPAEAEVHYLVSDLEESQYFFRRLTSTALGWSFTVNHAHILPIGIDKFMDGMDLSRCGEVRIADCRGTIEEHLYPGEGTIDFPSVFARIEKAGYQGHYMMAFGSLDDMLRGRETLAAFAEQGLKRR